MPIFLGAYAIYLQGPCRPNLPIPLGVHPPEMARVA